MLRQFHYIDQNGKDQGINVRNRAKELGELLSDVDRIRSERKKAKTNRNKFGGVEGGAMSGGMSSESRYGGFGNNEEYGGYSGGVYGDGGGFGGRDSTFTDTQNRRDRFEEYDEYDEGAAASSRRKVESSISTPKKEVKKADPPKPKEPEIDLLEDIPPETPPKEFAPSSAINGKKPMSSAFDGGFGSMQSGGTAGADDDDFDDFQSATPTITNATNTSAMSSIPNLPAPITASVPNQNTQFAAPRPSGPSASTFSNMGVAPPTPSSASGMASPPAPNYHINMNAPTAAISPTPAQQPSRTTSQQPTPSQYQPSAPNYFQSVPAPQAPSATPTSTGGRPTPVSTSSFSKPAAKPSAGGGDAFGNIWSSASVGAGIRQSSTASSSQGPNLASLQKEKVTQGLFGMGPASSQQAKPGMPTMGMNAPQAANGQRNAGGGGGALGDLLG